MDGPAGPEVAGAVIDAFCFDGPVIATAPLPGGHIHRNLLLTCTGGRYIVQRLNDRVFPDLDAVVGNGERVTTHLAASGRRCSELVATRGGGLSHREPNGSVWRSFRFLEGTEGRAVPGSPTDVFEAARLFADYVTALGDLPGPPLAETIDRFHDLPHRLAVLDTVAAADPVGRRSGVPHDLDRARRLGHQVEDVLRPGAGAVPVRTVHNDAKLSNVRLDTDTGLGACVVDLDTTMAGRIQYDVGELVRTTTTHAAEDAGDERDVDFDLEVLDALTAGYMAASPPLEGAELDAMALAGPLMAVENAVRFLTDHLDGDLYFAVDRPGQNLDRCRTQLRLTELMLDSHADMAASFARDARSSGGPS
jgi:Ser/Thr protein kinase RdoA (MazF antagonist)